MNCIKGPGGGPAKAVEQVDGRWYCLGHIGAAKAVAAKRRDRNFGRCSVPRCTRPAVERDGKCNEHRAGERAAGGTGIVVYDGSGKGDHPYAPKRTEIYLALFPELGLLKVGKATPWTVHNRVKDAADKLRIRQAYGGVERPITCEAIAWAVPLFGDENVLWAVSERVEHAAAGRLAHNVGATSVAYTEGKEWLRPDPIRDVDWPTQFHRAVCETLAFFGHDEANAGKPRRLE
ncbi:MAG: hypothetical protein ACR2ML_14510 [Solirubrobacteraceae bacterium]